MSRKNNRHQYFIKKKFQIDFIIRFCILLLFSVLVSTVLLLIFSRDTVTSTYTNSGLEIQSTALAILPGILFTHLITLGIISLCAIVLLVYLSHRIAGPLFRFEKDINRITNGDLTVQIHLRENDQFKDLANALNLMVHSFNIKVDSINACLGEIQLLHAQDKAIDSKVAEARAWIQKNFRLTK